MIIRTAAATLLLGASFALSPAYAQSTSSTTTAQQPDKPMTAADLDALRADLRSSKKQAVASNLTLTDAEATKFWPIYDQYSAELAKINDGQATLIAEYVNNYGKYDDKGAIDFINRWLDLDVKTSALRAKYVPIVAKVLPGIKAATFFQIDRRLSKVLDLQIASKLPLLQYQTAK
jgi:D-alanyl-D-alanine carboxypeptidase